MLRWLKFSTVLWLALAVLAGYLLFWPLVMNVWAERNWVKVPAHVTRDEGAGIGYHYKVGEGKYLSNRRDFWQFGARTGRGIQGLEPNGTCWVNPRNPEDSVLVLDWRPGLERIMGRLAAAIGALVATVMITWRLRVEKRKSALAESQKQGA